VFVEALKYTAAIAATVTATLVAVVRFAWRRGKRLQEP
jgi:hypothetical protein